jgi:ornithine carbamoyltransferase
LPTLSTPLPAPPPGIDADVLLAHLRELQQRRGVWLPLQGKFLGLMCASEDSEEARRFRRAATELGARVAWIRPSQSTTNTPEQTLATARVLGKLYDAIECQGVDAALVQQIRGCAGVPVFDGLAVPAPTAAALAHALGDTVHSEDERRQLVQAGLLSVLS